MSASSVDRKAATARAAISAPQGALDGVRIADFSWAAATPIATRMLADHGATVVRVESKSHVDTVRITGPFRNNEPGINKSGFYADFNSSKYGLALDMKQPSAHAIARRLIEWADVVVESFTPRVMAGWHLAYADIVKWKPEVIMLSSCMQGQTGPYRDYPGFGGQGAALAGLHYVTGWPDRVAAGPKGAYTDGIAPRFVASSILAALEYSARTGRGQHIDFAQVEAAISGFIATEVLDYTVNGNVATSDGNRSPHCAPHGCFACNGEDRWITIAIESDAQWVALRNAMGDPEWASDSKFQNLEGRLAFQDDIEREIEAWTRQHDAFDLADQFQACGIPAAPVQDAVDLFNDTQLAHRGHFRALDHVEMGTVSYNGPAHLLSETPAVLRWAAPCLGEHTTQVLKEFLGYSDDEIAKFTDLGLLA
jgi:benzylsuccinate CoA-transferase BbsF subunit